jgi:MFS family permease
MDSNASGTNRMNATAWLICIIASIGFAFDTYELLMLPLIAGPALSELLGKPLGDPAVRDWVGYIFWTSAATGGIFGLLGGYLTDRFGRKRVLVWSIMVYSLSPVAAAFSTSALALLIFRCTTFIGVCVEFVAAVAWLAESFPEPKLREKVLGWTQAFSSVGGVLVTSANFVAVKYASALPAIHAGHSSWRYTLLSGLIPAIPLAILLPKLPESPAWMKRRLEGTLRRPRLSELFAPGLCRTTVVTSILFACAYGAAFGAIQLTPTQIVPGLPELRQEQATVATVRPQIGKLTSQLKAMPANAPNRGQTEADLKKAQDQMRAASDTIKQAGNRVQFYQEIGGLVGRILLAILAVVIVSRRTLLRVFQVPGLIIVPLVFYFPARNDLELLKWGMFFAGLLTVAQFSYWGNYLPRVYPVHLRGTGESFAANVGGRMIGTSAAYVTTNWFAPMMSVSLPYHKIATGAALMALLVYGLGFITSFFLPEPPKDQTLD